MPRTSKDVGLALQTDPQGQVWSSRLNQTPRRTRLAPEQFVANAEFYGPVRVLGGAENADLLCRLWESRERFPDMRLLVATPRMAEVCETIPDILTVVTQSPQYAPSLGGWHAYDERDNVSYAMSLLCDSRTRSNMELANRLQLLAALLQRHPVWPRISFVRSLSRRSLALWLGAVRDPRWFISVRDPDRTGPLERFLGLWADNQADATLGHARGEESYRFPYRQRCMITQQCWLPEPAPGDEEADLEDPRNFLLRVFARRVPQDPVLAIVRTSQLFTRFVRSLWLSALSSGPGTADALFDPEQFLKADELEAYLQFSAAPAP